MIKCLYLAVTCAFVVALCSAFENQAYAYADPGSSLLLYQGVSSLLTGALFFFRGKLKAMLRRSAQAD